MGVKTANLGFPRIGAQRELKTALEAYWRGDLSQADLQQTTREIRRSSWQLQRDAGVDLIPSNDFSLYDHILDMVAMLGAVPPRFGHVGGPIGLDTYFAMARGTKTAKAMEMTKWFDTNYHYIVPEFEANQRFYLGSTKVIDEFREAKELGFVTRPVLLGPVSFLLLGKATTANVTPLSFLDRVLGVYTQVLERLRAAGAESVQVDEPVLGLDLDESARQAYSRAYKSLANAAGPLQIFLTTYFSPLRENLKTALQLPVAGVHLDLVRGPEQLDEALAAVPADKTVSLGVVDGRNIWKNPLSKTLSVCERALSVLGPDRLILAPSCSLLHSPVDLDLETDLEDHVKERLAFARQKLQELQILKTALNEGPDAVADALEANDALFKRVAHSTRVHNPQVKARVGTLAAERPGRASPFAVRKAKQQERLNLPVLPTTTIGSYPQTPEIRKARAAFKRGQIDASQYEAEMKRQVLRVVRFQEQAGLDVLVHGEPERNDMVEYFGERLEGFAHTRFGWVQSYGSRCVKPPIIHGDVSRPKPMTVDWIRYAQSLTSKPVKGMLTGPITILQWSFVRDDQPRKDTAFQIAAAIRDEIEDLEAAGTGIIQIDEPALREGLPLRQSEWPAYLRWAVQAFQLASCGVRDETQIHTHMCYADFNDIIEAIAALDADVISMEASRSGVELLGTFAHFQYPNQVGPGVYDVHSPRVPSAEEMADAIKQQTTVLNVDQLWVNPDCGLKTRRWEEVEPALKNMVAAARQVRASLAPKPA
ncbi:MAG: 5-methyltetrahydropteroyltriglutamate--homocysteine S-methyltransferase [Sedimentisphaerales bacterium]|nr:5-methyltetrahydropteroyltriglutamate--homocysteine S-methyltransferase [Sedimentisphaerales bacterium]